MSELEGFSYAVFAVYAATSVGLGLAAVKLAPARNVEWRRGAFALGAVILAGLWPLIRAGNPLPMDALRAHLDGQAGDLVGHLLLALGALTAMTAEVQLLTCLRSGEAVSAMAATLVPVGRGLVLSGLILVFPDIVQAALSLVAAAVVFASHVFISKS